MNALTTLYRNQLAENQRQGLCHVSQILELLLIKYGLDTQESVSTKSEFKFPEQQTATNPLSAPCKQDQHQATFAWFDTAEISA